MQVVRTTVKVHRAPRQWPYVPPEPITIQLIQPTSKQSGASIIATAASLVGILLSAVIYAKFGGTASSPFILGLLAVSGLSMIASAIVFYAQMQSANDEARELATRYKEYLDIQEEQIKALANEENIFRNNNHLPVAEMVAGLANDADRAWQRRPDDPDFLDVRIGTGNAPAWIRVELAAQGPAFAPPPKALVARQLQARAMGMVNDYAVAHNVPITIALRDFNGVALVGESAAALAQAMVAQIVLHHAPQDVHLAVFVPEAQVNQWGWVQKLPGVSGDPWQGLGATQKARSTMLSALLGELNHRSQMKSEESVHEGTAPPLPYLVIVVDSFADTREPDPLKSGAVALALRDGKHLGAVVISAHTHLRYAPSEAGVAVDIARKRVLPLGPNPAHQAPCATIDVIDTQISEQVMQALTGYVLDEESPLTLPNEVRLLQLFDPPINRHDVYDIREEWGGARQRVQSLVSTKSFAIPIGRRMGNEVVTLDFVKDGPHGLLIGQTRSGKSELLRSIITALAIAYPPDMVNFVLVDYKGGLAFDAFEQLPHTVAYLTNMMQVGQTTRFLSMLDHELTRRQEARIRQKPVPKLFVIIDEFAEVVSARSGTHDVDAILEHMLSIARLGGELGVHLLFASQRPEGRAIQQLRGYVQFRICLRTNTPEDSREVIGRPDAAQIPNERQGRGYLLRGDNKLELFQAARIAVKSISSEHRYVSAENQNSINGSLPPTVDAVIARRMRQEPGVILASPWPRPLPTPSQQVPTPLVLLTEPGAQDVVEAWNDRKRPDLQPMVVPLGLIDRPATQQQEWFLADLAGTSDPLSGGPLLVTGDRNAGKTTTLQTLLLALASTRSPQDVRWFILDPIGSLADFAMMPHTQDIFDHSVINYCDGQEDATFTAFSDRFKNALEANPASRQSLVLVIDDYDDLGVKFSDRLHIELVERAIRNRTRKVHLATAASASRSSYNSLPNTVINSMATRIALYTSDPEQMRGVLTGRIPRAFDAIPGRGIVQTRRAIGEIQIASPVYGIDDTERQRRLTAAIQRFTQSGR